MSAFRLLPIALFAGLAAPALAEPAAAVTGAAGDCVVARMPAADRARIIEGMVGSDRAATKAPPEQQFTALAPTVALCAAELHWSDADRVRHGTAAFTRVSHAELRAVLARGRVDPDVVDHWFAAQPEAARIDVEVSEARVLPLVQTLIEAGIPMETIFANAFTLGNYLGASTAMERLRRGIE